MTVTGMHGRFSGSKLIEGHSAKINLIPQNEWPARLTSGRRQPHPRFLQYYLLTAGYASRSHPAVRIFMPALGQLKSATERNT